MPAYMVDARGLICGFGPNDFSRENVTETTEMAPSILTENCPYCSSYVLVTAVPEICSLATFLVVVPRFGPGPDAFSPSIGGTV